jgi:hypothetical protein
VQKKQWIKSPKKLLFDWMNFRSHSKIFISERVKLITPADIPKNNISLIAPSASIRTVANCRNKPLDKRNEFSHFVSF